MEVHRGFVEDLAIVFCVAAITTVVCRKLRQPVVLGYLVAGLIVGPYIPIPLVADLDRVHTLSELGVILVMFAIGLEFSFRKLIRMAPTSGIIALIQIAFMIWLGYLTGEAFGWTRQESLFTGAMIAISSTMIIAKAFSEYSTSQRVRDIVLGVLIFEDIVAVLLLAMLTAFAATGETANSVLPTTASQLIAFLVVMVFAGFFIIPRSVRAIVKLDNPETLLIASIGICFGMAYLAQKVGYSVALGSFLAGALVAESGEATRIEHLIQSVRDVFAAIFFISVGMLMNPALLLQYWPAVLVLTLVVLFGKMISVTFGALLTGNDIRTSVQSGMSMAQIREFSFIIVSAGLASRAIAEFLYPVAIAVAIITTFTTPWLISQSGKAASWVDRKLPESIRTFLTLYGSWIQRLRRVHPTTQSKYKRLVLILLLDTISLIILIIGTAVGTQAIAGLVEKLTGLKEPVSRWVVIGLACLATIPFLIGMIRSAKALGILLAEYVMPSAGTSKVDLAEAPRNLMVVTLEYGTVLVLAIVILAITQPFLPPIPAAAVILLFLIVVAIIIAQKAGDLQGHLRAGGQIILAALAKQSKAERTQQKEVGTQLEEMLPGLGTVLPVELDASHSSVGKSLGELNLHSLTGASVISINRASEGVVAPSGSERLSEGDVLTLIGTEEAVESAKELLTQPKPPVG